MYYYFSSNCKCAIKINGKYIDKIHNEVKFIDRIEENAFIELCPLNTLGQSVSFILDKEFLTSPPLPLSVTDIGGGYLIKYNKVTLDTSFYLICQQKFSNALITVFNENGKKLSIETPYGVYAEKVDFSFDSAEILPFFDNYNYYVILFKGEQTFVCVYNLESEIKKVLSFTCSEFNSEDMTFYTFYKDIAKHILKEKLTFDGEIKKERVSLSCKKEVSIYNLNEELIPYAMLEELLLCGNVSPFLTGNILENKDKLKGFFNDYIGIMPPPFFRSENEVGLIYKIKENLYKVEYFTFTLLGKKINGIKKDA